MHHAGPWLLLALLLYPVLACATAERGREETPQYDVIVRGGTVYDGSGGPGRVADVAISGDRIAAIGDLSEVRGKQEIPAQGLAVAPGFINMLSWADEPLLIDPRSLSDISQGVTLEVFGEGWSMGPLSEAMKEARRRDEKEAGWQVAWTTLGEYLAYLEQRGVSPNVASFVGATTLRIHVIGYDDRPATPEELVRMQELARQAMHEGAMGVASSLPYTPAVYASTEELIALARVAAESGGMYISHIRNEGDRVFEGLDEFLRIVRESGARGEIYHLKVSGKENWGKLPELIHRIEAARAEGLAVTANLYPYPASGTGLAIVFPPWVQEGGHDAFVARLKDPQIRRRLVAEMDMIPPEDILLVSFRNPALRPLTGRTLASVANERGTSAEETAMDLIIEDNSRVGTVRFTMSEENVAREIALPWVSFGSDAGSIAPEPPFTDAQPHPRAYGTFARVLGRYVREEKRISLAEAVRRLAALPAANLRPDH
ncbi:MAG TPA: D-aminoacylase, partial [Thermoanaerobaculia bacterium]|nr:D-aminoacylase [Thermoanaerobaculia bacterium]